MLYRHLNANFDFIYLKNVNKNNKGISTFKKIKFKKKNYLQSRTNRELDEKLNVN